METKENIAEIKSAFEEWERKHAEEFEKERKEEFKCESGIPVKRVYTPLDLEEKGFNYMRDLGLPGEYPYTRGITSTMYRSQPILMTQYFGHPTPEESNKAWKSQIAAGTNTLSMAFDLPTQLGYDPDHPMAEGEAGRIGVSMSSLKDWEIGYDGIDLGKVTPYQVMNAVYIVAFAFHIAMAEEQGVELKNISGIGQNDVLKEYTARGNFIYPPRQAMRLASDTLVYAGENLPLYFPITVCGVHQSERGAHPVHEGASTLANVFVYLQSAVDRGIDIDLIAPKVMFLPSVEHHGFFQEVAKLRAMRKIYAQVLKERFKAKDPKSWTARWYAAMGGLSLHREQYLNNIARGGLAAFAAACAGCQIVDLRAYDEQFGIPTREAAVQSIHTMQVAAYETGVSDTVDPLGGSYFVETLTSEFEERIWEELERIEKFGGVIRCIETGYFQRQYTEDAYQWQRDFESGRVERVGVNIFRDEFSEEARPTRVYRADPKVTQARIDAVREVKQKRDNAKVRKALDEIKAVASAPDTRENNLVRPVIEAVKCYATVGEIADALREIWGEYKVPSGL